MPVMQVPSWDPNGITRLHYDVDLDRAAEFHSRNSKMLGAGDTKYEVVNLSIGAHTITKHSEEVKPV